MQLRYEWAITYQLSVILSSNIHMSRLCYHCLDIMQMYVWNFILKCVYLFICGDEMVNVAITIILFRYLSRFFQSKWINMNNRTATDLIINFIFRITLYYFKNYISYAVCASWCGLNHNKWRSRENFDYCAHMNYSLLLQTIV